MRGIRPGKCLMTGGLLLLAAALFLVGCNLWNDWRAGNLSEEILAGMPDAPQTEEGIPDYVLNPGIQMPVVTIDGDDYIGTLEIPALNLTLPVMSEWSYPGLKTAPCRYAGSAYRNNLVIAAHNYRSHFGGIGSLKAGERVVFNDTEGNRFLYDVAEIQILDPGDVGEMTAEEWDLTLFTCTPGGRTRLTVRCSGHIL